MSQPTAYPGRPAAPASGVPTPELRIARVRSHARRLFWSALVLIAAAGAVGYFTDNLPESFPDWIQNWMLWAVAGVVVLLLVVLPFLRWLGHTYTVTTRRVIEQRGVFGRSRRELLHARGYTISERRGLLQRLWGAGTLTLTSGADVPLQMRNIPAVRLVHEVLSDQVEVGQILAHRDSQRDSPWDSHAAGAIGDPPPLP